MFVTLSALVYFQTASPLDKIPKEFEFKRQLETGKYFRPWIERIKQGDPWAFPELVLECNRISNYMNGFGFDLEGLAIKDVEPLRALDPGRACYYLAKLTRISGAPGKRNAPYVALLEESSKHGYAWADLELYRECQQGGAYSRIKIPVTEDKVLQNNRRLELEKQCKRKAFERLVPLAQRGDVEAQIRVHALHEPRFDHLLDKGQMRSLLEDSARKGSLRAQALTEDLRLSDSSPEAVYHPLKEGTPAFRILEKRGGQFDPDAIHQLVDFFYGKKEWAKAKIWATKGKEALGGTNRWLERAWEDEHPEDIEQPKKGE